MYSEEILKNCNSLQQIRTAVAGVPTLASEIADSVEPVKLLMTDLFQRLGLKGKKIKMGTPATETECKDRTQRFSRLKALTYLERLERQICHN